MAKQLTLYDLFFALKGGYNNFGIVTQFTFKTFPQKQVWAGQLLFPQESQEEMNMAISSFFATSTDPKATMLVQYRYTTQLSFEVTVFYDGPSPPEGLFDEILSVPNIDGTPTVSNFTTMLTYGTPDVTGTSFAFTDAPVISFPKAFLDIVANETAVLGATLAGLSATFSMNMIWQNLPNYLSHGPESAWPGDRSKFFSSINGWALWDDNNAGSMIVNAMQASGKKLQTAAEALGQNLTGVSKYPNICPADTPLEEMYGDHVDRLRKIRLAYDPNLIMDLTGGFHF